LDIPLTASGVAAKRKWRRTCAGHACHFGQCPSNSCNHALCKQLGIAGDVALLQPVKHIHGVAIAAIDERGASLTILRNLRRQDRAAW
jgi:hypothetical protein